MCGGHSTMGHVASLPITLKAHYITRCVRGGSRFRSFREESSLSWKTTACHREASSTQGSFTASSEWHGRLTTHGIWRVAGLESMFIVTFKNLVLVMVSIHLELCSLSFDFYGDIIHTVHFSYCEYTIQWLVKNIHSVVWPTSKSMLKCFIITLP